MSRASKMIFTLFVSAMVWLGLFLATDSSTDFLKFHNIIIGLPSFFLISFGCYAMFEIGKGLSNLKDQDEESLNNLKDIKRAKDFLVTKGFYD